MTHDELLLTPEYWTTKIQFDLYQKVEEYIKEQGINRTEFAKRLGVSKGYVTQLLNGDYNHRISKLVELAIAIGYFPELSFEPINKNAICYEHIERIITKARELSSLAGYYIYVCKPKYNNGISSDALSLKDIKNKPNVA